MIKKFHSVRFTAMLCFIVSINREKVFAQAELQAWGNMSGIRIQGELMEFESSIRLVGNSWNLISSTGKEQQSPKYNRDSNRQVVQTKLGTILFSETVTDFASGKATVAIRFTTVTDTMMKGSFFCISLPLKEYGQGFIRFENGNPETISGLKADIAGILIQRESREISIHGISRQLSIQCPESGSIYIREGKPDQHQIEIYFPLLKGSLAAGQSGEKLFTILASGQMDKKDIHLAIDKGKSGRTFDGIGGNFRIQNIKTDPAVIDYCLKNLKVAWGRVEMPWRFWQPEKNMDPIASGKAGHLDDHVQRAMGMAQKLQQLGIPIILTDWSAPDWAVNGKPHFNHQPGELWGNPLNPDSILYTYRSIADYIQYLKDQYSVEVKYFSFNESDLGIYVRQTGEQHAELIKGLGNYFLSRGIKTKLLLGDNSDATTYTFIDPALKDLSTRPFIGAVSFHSWRGWDRETLLHWTQASEKINLPLIVGEGSIDAAAWAYPAIFEEPVYAMEEINLYIRLMAICQPVSILQWQLTADYSLLSGGGVFGKSGPLSPTQRFWNLKQLASIPGGLNYLPVINESNNVNCVALGNTRTGKIVLHIVNNGAKRNIILSGIPAGQSSFKIYLTGQHLCMQESKKPVTVKKGEAKFILPEQTFATLISQ